MTIRPRDVTDLRLAPVTLALDAALDELAPLTGDQLVGLVELRTGELPTTPDERAAAMLRTVCRGIDTRGWVTGWTPRGLRVSHGRHQVVLGVPANVRAYLEP